MTVLILFFLLAIMVSFACSIWEAVLLSITPSYVTRANSEGRRTGKLLNEFKQDIDRPLAAILTLNTIAHTVGAIGVGAQASRLWGSGGIELAGMTIDYEAIVAAVTTLGILVLSEIIPKTLGANYWERLAPLTVRSLKVLILVLYPLVWMSQVITRFLKKDKSLPVFSRHEFLAMTEMGRSEGQLDEREATVIRNLLSLNQLRVHDVMTPRPVVVGGDQEQTVAEFMEENPDLVFSRIPVFDGEIDTVTGLVFKDDLLAAMAAGEGGHVLAELEREVLFVPETLSVAAVLPQLLEKRQQLAVAVDEYGVTAGVITVEDVLETLLGLEIMDEMDSVADLQRLARERWKERHERLGSPVVAATATPSAADENSSREHAKQDRSGTD
jgi:CBS domain containing-hemolysin-like protein